MRPLLIMAVFFSLSLSASAQDFDKGTALQVATQTSLLGINLFGEHSEYFDFSSERVLQTADKLLSESNARIDGSVPAWWVVPYIPISLTADVERRESGRISTAFTWCRPVWRIAPSCPA